MSVVKALADFFSKRQILLGIVSAILIASLMTLVSLKLYDLDDVSRLDVSLPKRESIRPSTSENDVQKFNSSGRLDDQALSDFQSLFTKNRLALDALGRFDSDALNRVNLRIGLTE